MCVKDERELAKPGCILDPEDPNRAIPIQKGQRDLFDRSIPELEDLAKKEYDALLGIERQSVASYWRLGDVLTILRDKNQIPHSEWMKYVTGLGINYTRAKRALRIRKRHNKPEDCLDKSIDDALDYEQSEENDQTTNAPSAPKPVGARPKMHVQHQPEEQEEEGKVDTEELTDENEGDDSQAEEDSIADADQPPVTPEELMAVQTFVAAVGGWERAFFVMEEGYKTWKQNQNG